MTKIMEIYSVNNGLILKQTEKVYHLFIGVENKEITTSVKIGDSKDAFEFLVALFGDKLKVDTKKILSLDSFETRVVSTIAYND